MTGNILRVMNAVNKDTVRSEAETVCRTLNVCFVQTNKLCRITIGFVGGVNLWRASSVMSFSAALN